MAVEDIEWRERYGDQSYKMRSLFAIRIAFLALTFSQTIILPSLPSFLSALHSHPSMVGYCLAAQCLGELCMTQIFSNYYDRRPAREVVCVALLISAAGNLCYSASPHRLAVLASRFIVGGAFGVREVLMTLVGGFTHRGNRAQVLSSLRSMHVAALVLGLGLAAVATFWHMPAPKPFGGLQYKIPSYVKSIENHSEILVNQSLAIDNPFEFATNFILEGIGGSSVQFSSRRFLGEDLQLVDPDIENVVGSFIEDAGNGDNLIGNSSSPIEQQPSEVGTYSPGVETDQDIGDQIGDRGLYIPGYLTALVGHGLKAPGYIACCVSISAAIVIWRSLEEGPRKIPTQRVPLVHLSPRSLSYFSPLAACLALESLAQACYVALETSVATIIRLRGNWLVDATAVSMLFISASGVVGLALVERLKLMYSVRHVMIGCVALVILGNVYCLPWSQRPSVYEYILGCSISAVGFLPLSTLSSQVFSLGIVKIYSDQGEMVWLQLFWCLTSVPIRVVGPILLSTALERDSTGMICYLILLGFSMISLFILLYLQTALVTPQTVDQMEVLPGSSNGQSFNYVMESGISAETSPPLFQSP